MGIDKAHHSARARSEAIDRELMQMAREDEHIVKILLLGKYLLSLLFILYNFVKQHNIIEIRLMNIMMMSSHISMYPRKSRHLLL